MAIKTALIGYGRNGSFMHADPVKNSDEFEMVAVCDIDPNQLKLAKEKFDCPVYSDYKEMLAEEAIDFVQIVTRSSQHHDMAVDALKAGCHVLVTKPWGIDSREVKSLYKTAKECGKLFIPWLPVRWSCDMRRIKELLAENVIGDVFMIRRSVSSFGLRDDWQTLKEFGGGYILNWGPHIVDPPVQLMDSPIQSVYAVVKQTINPGDVEDVFLSIIKLKNGVTVHSEYTISVEGPPNWHIQGTKGTIIARDNEIRVYKNNPARREDPTVVQSMQPHKTMKSDEDGIFDEKLDGNIYGDEHEIYVDIAKAIQGKTEYPVSEFSATQLAEALDAIKKSSESNDVVVFSEETV